MKRCPKCFAPQPLTMCQTPGCETSAPDHSLQAFDDRDAIDKLAATDAKDWKRLLDPIVGEVMRAAQSSTTEKEFLAKLRKLNATIDPEELVQQLATSTFKARGQGDATDSVTG